MIKVGHYLREEASYKDDAWAVLKTHFARRSAFEEFYADIPVSQRNDFLRVCALYRYLAKHGDWKVKVRGVAPTIAYLTNSYKLVTLFSLIESLSNLDHRDFYHWLCDKKRMQPFPISDKEALESLYIKYKKDYGATRRCEKFFAGLPLNEQNALCEGLSINEKPTADIKKFTAYLYQMRSGFVHNGDLSSEIDGPDFVLGKKNVVQSTLTIDAIFHAFESGLLVHFKGSK